MSDSYLLRLPDGMRERLRKSAEVNRRSMNSEIIFHLDRAVPDDETATGATPGSTTPVAVES